jgi:hypothetical protein
VAEYGVADMHWLKLIQVHISIAFAMQVSISRCTLNFQVHTCMHIEPNFHEQGSLFSVSFVHKQVINKVLIEGCGRPGRSIIGQKIGSDRPSIATENS